MDWAIYLAYWKRNELDIVIYFYFRRPDFDKDYKTYKDSIANNELLLENFMIQVSKCFVYLLDMFQVTSLLFLIEIV